MRWIQDVRWLWAALATLSVFAVPLEGQTTGTVSGVVTDRQGQLVTAAEVSIQSTAVRSLTDDLGRFRLTGVPAGDQLLRVRTLGYAPAERAISVTAGGNTQQNLVLEIVALEIAGLTVSVGTRRVDRTVVESPVPVDVLLEEDLAQTGAVQTAEIIQALIPSFEQPRINRGDGNETIRPATIRAMGSDQLLVLVNGKRRHVAAHLIGDNTGVDLNAIPAEAIQRIEVLRDGASAQYGSDAIAGVINIVLKESTDLEVSGKTGLTTRGDGAVVRTSVNKGWSVKEDGYVHLAGELLHTQQVIRAGVDQRRQYFGTIRDDEGNVVFSDPVGDSLNAAWALNPQRTMLEGDPQRNSEALFYNARVPLGTAAPSFYAFGGVSHKDVLNGSCRFREPKASGTVRAIHPAGFLARQRMKSTDVAATAGLDGAALGGQWDLSAGYGANWMDYNIENSNNPSLGTASPTDFDLGTILSQQVSGNLGWVRALPFGRVTTLALGAEARGENYRIGEGEWASWVNGGVPILDGPDAGAPASPGSQCYVGYRPENAVDEWRGIAAGYAELETEPVAGLLFSAAGRAERYSDFGSTVNGKLAARFEPLRGVAFRGSASTGFRAPSLHQSHFSQTQTNFRFDPEIGAIVSRLNSTFALGSPAANALGAPALEPETSVSYSAGLALNPVRALSLTVDYYDTEVQDRIVRSSFFTVDNPQVRDLFLAQGLTSIQSARFFANAIDIRTKGWDVVAAAAFEPGRLGRTRVTASYNTTDNEVLGTAATPPELAGLEETIFNESRARGVERSFPDNNVSLVLDHQKDAWSFMLRNIRSGKTVGANPVEEVPGINLVPAAWYTDVDLAYRFRQGPMRGLTIAAGGTNIFDQMPPYADPAASFSGNFRYVNSGQTSYGSNGAFFYLRGVWRP